SDVLPELARAGRPLRVWSIGCGRGEEAYTFAMLLAEAGAEGTVHSTDVDLEALRDAADGCYEGEALEELPADLAQRYVETLAGTGVPRYRVREEIRRRVVFSAHDITREDGLPGGSRFDLVAFRNVSIYLKRAAQERAFERVTNAIAPGGCLCLGESEWPPLALESRLRCRARRLRLFRIMDGVERAAA
ncbi:MAG: hypothetical protein IT508_11415, partial [Burkholderiaceae bacterium]|nr:hypothetical protein [Burkholderiaceae bacterium]